MDAMDISCISARELTSDLKNEWLRLQASNPMLTSPFFHPSFTTILGAQCDDVYVSIVRTAGSIVGFFPFQKNHLDIARPLPMADYQGVIAAPDACIDMREVLKASGLVAWDFEQLVAAGFLIEQADCAFSYPLRGICLSGGYTKYAQNLKNMHSRWFSTIMRKMRKLEREVGALTLQSETTRPEVLRILFEWKSLQYNEGRQYEPWRWQCFKDIFSSQDRNFQGSLSALYAGNELIAAHFGLCANKIMHWWFPSYSPRWARYSPGSILLLMMAESFSARGVEYIDLGAGDEPYKSLFGNDVRLVVQGTIEVPSLVTVRRKIRRFARKVLLKTPGFRALVKIVRRCR